jgi:hypothetical protein
MMMSRLLRLTLLADAAATTATALLMFVAAAPLAPLLGLPQTLLTYAGVALFPYAAVVAYLGSRRRVARAAVWAVIACNLAWAADTLLLLATGWIEPTTFGYAFVIGQALIVALFAEVQYIGLRQSAAAVDGRRRDVSASPNAAAVR